MHQGYHKKTCDPWPTECAHLCNHLSKYTNLVYTKTVNKIAGLLRFYSNFKYLVIHLQATCPGFAPKYVVIITETFCNVIPLFWYLQKQLFTSVLVASDGFLPCCYKIKWIVVKYLMHCVELNTPFLSLKKRISDIKVVTYCLRVEIAISRRLAYPNYVLTLKWMSQLLLVTYY